MISPRPAPSRKNMAPTVHSDVLPDRVVIQTIAARITATPAMVKTLYRPDVRMTWAEPWMVTMMPAVIGSMSRPELAAESPELICRNVGMNAIAENMPRPTAMPSAVATTKVGLPNSESGMIGSMARRSTSTKATAETTNAAIMARVRPAPQPSLPPKSVNRTSEVVVADSATMPQWSRGALLCLRGRVSANQPTANAASPTGTLTQKHHCQPRLAESVKKPPTSGPITADRPNSAPIGPMYFARSRAGTTSAMIACERIISPPPPSPWTPRQMTSQVKSGDRAAPRLATVNSPIAMRKRLRRPHRSPNLPQTGITSVVASRYAVVIQAMWDTPPRSP